MYGKSLHILTYLLTLCTYRLPDEQPNILVQLTVNLLAGKNTRVNTYLHCVPGLPAKIQTAR